ncbi:ankyrin repeat-containing domain protein [Podospora didyma]|uniref:protein S-acyltransferase n=1 Tax=Podospora didyma TaxID=330526 RepID=A0AAE0P5A6_9PEZI|nr:ankyrin repeat-containing domain protein [Podospora didyma]
MTDPGLPVGPLGPSRVNASNQSGLMNTVTGNGPQYVAVHGGSIRVYNSTDNGTTSEVVLPAASVALWLNSLAAPLAMLDRHNELLRKRAAGTCDWVFESKPYVAWKQESSQCQILWMHGNFGCGKSVLASYIAHSLRKEAKATSDPACLYLSFCDEPDQKQPEFDQIIAAMIKQLVEQKEDRGIYVTADLNKHHQNYMDDPGSKQLPSSEIFELLLSRELEFSHQVYMIIDGLEYCNKAQSALIQMIQRLSLNMKVKVLFTTRSGEKLAGDLKHDQELHLDIEATQSDIRRYILYRIRTEKAMEFVFEEKQQDAGFLGKVVDHVLQETNGIFHLARSHVDWLSAHAFDVVTFERTLSELPKQGSDVFSNGIKHIENLNQDKTSGVNSNFKKLVIHVITWLLYRCNTTLLPIDDLRHSFAIQRRSADNVRFLKTKQPPPVRDYLRAEHDFICSSSCGGLVVMDKTKTVRFIHDSVQHHFREYYSKFELPNDPHAEIASQCLRYLLCEEVFPSSMTMNIVEEQLRKYPFLRYAANYWSHHLHKAKEKDCGELVSLAVEFLRDTTKVTNSFFFVELKQAQKVPNTGVTGLHAAVYFNCQSLAERLIQDGCDAAATCNEGQTPVHWAAKFRRDHRFLKLLLRSSGHPLEVVDQSGNTPLHLAVMAAKDATSQDSHRSLLRELLARESPHTNHSMIHKENYSKESPYIMALKGGSKYMYVTKELARHNRGETPLGSPLRVAMTHSPSADMFEAVVESLLKAGRDARINASSTLINTPLEDGWTPLVEATKRGLIDIISLLLRHGADVNVMDQDGKTPLRWAIKNNNIQVAELLIQHEPDLVRYPYADGLTPLIQATCRQLQSHVWLLLKYNAPLNSQDMYGRTALHWAVINSHDSVAWLLLSKGANPSLRSKNGLSPLDEAINRRHLSMTTLLCVVFKVDLHSVHAPLHRAVIGGDQEIVRLLLTTNLGDKKFLQAKDSRGLTALRYAMSSQRLFPIMKMLIIQFGASCEVRDETGATVLHYAIAAGVQHGEDLDELVHFLVKNAEGLINVQDHIHQLTPLMLAAEMGQHFHVYLLLQGGANMDLKNVSGLTARDIAERYGHGDTIDIFDRWKVERRTVGKMIEGAPGQQGFRNGDSEKV